MGEQQLQPRGACNGRIPSLESSVQSPECFSTLFHQGGSPRLIAAAKIPQALAQIDALGAIVFVRTANKRKWMRSTAIPPKRSRSPSPDAARELFSPSSLPLKSLPVATPTPPNAMGRPAWQHWRIPILRYVHLRRSSPRRRFRNWKTLPQTACRETYLASRPPAASSLPKVYPAK